MFPLLLMLGWNTLVLNTTCKHKQNNDGYVLSPREIISFVLSKLFIYLGRFERIILREIDSDKENTSCVWTFVRTHYCSLPMKHVFSYWTWKTHNQGETKKMIKSYRRNLDTQKEKFILLPALHDIGGSLCNSLSSFKILLVAIVFDSKGSCLAWDGSNKPKPNLYL